MRVASDGTGPCEMISIAALPSSDTPFHRRLLQRRTVADGLARKFLWDEVSKSPKMDPWDIRLTPEDIGRLKTATRRTSNAAPAVVENNSRSVVLHFLDGTALLAEPVSKGKDLRLLPVIFNTNASVRPREGEPFCWRAMTHAEQAIIDGRGMTAVPAVSVLCVSRDSRRAVGVMAAEDSSALPLFNADFRSWFRYQLEKDVQAWIETIPRGTIPPALRQRYFALSECALQDLQIFLCDLATLVGMREGFGAPFTISVSPSPIRQDADVPLGIRFRLDGEPLTSRECATCLAEEVRRAMSAANPDWDAGRMFAARGPGDPAVAHERLMAVDGVSAVAPSAHLRTSVMARIAPYLSKTESLSKVFG